MLDFKTETRTFVLLFAMKAESTAQNFSFSIPGFRDPSF
jgi:hypothetical protein